MRIDKWVSLTSSLGLLLALACSAQAQSSGTFIVTGSVITARSRHTATLLNNGLVLIAGGDSSSATPLASAELYNPSTGTFTATGSMNYARWAHTATLLNNGKVLIVGGYGSTNILTSAELYDPSTGMFTATGSMATARYLHTATLLNNGSVLIAGGGNDIGCCTFNNLSSAELYNPSTGKFTATGSMTTARNQHTATLLNSGLVLIAGGNGGSGYLSTAELYNSSTGTFSATGSLNTMRESHTATRLSSGSVLIAGGYAGGCLWNAELYNPTTGTFTATGNLITPRDNNTATLLNDGTVLIVGGSNGTELSSAELYSPVAGTFSATDILNTARQLHTATLLNNGDVLIAAGYSNAKGTASSAELGLPPSITSATSATFMVGLVGTFTVTATGSPTPTLSESGALPSGISFNASTGVLSGTPASGTSGTYPITFTAHNGLIPDATQHFTLKVNVPLSLYSYSRAITISHTKVPNTDQTNFPVLIAGTYPYLADVDYGGNVTSDSGFDIAFASDSAGANPLAFEQDGYNATTGAVTFWVKLPTVSHTIDTVFYIFYGNSAATFDQSNKSAVWGSTYSGVWHMGNATALNVADSTSNGNNGNSFELTATTGKINGAANFNGFTQALYGPFQNVYLGTSASLMPSGAMSTSAWINASSSQLQSPQIITESDTNGQVGYNLYLYNYGYASFILDVGGWGSGYCSTQGTTALNDNSWHYVVGTYAGAGGAVNIYVDGALQATSTCPNQATTYNPGATVGMIGWKQDRANNEYFSGAIDEARVLASALSADWIATEYNNQSSPSTFYSIGSSGSDSLAPVFTSANDTGFTIGTSGSFNVTATGFPAPTLSESGALPSGISFNASTGILSGTPASGTSGSYPITFTASNGVNPNAVQNFTLEVAPPTITFTSDSSAAFAVGASGTFTVTATGSPAPTLSETGTLPSGVTFNATTGVLSGTPAAGTAGSYPITFTAHNGAEADATQNFTLNVQTASASAIYFYYGDTLGTTRVMSDSNGTLCYDADFYPYGGERVYTNACSQNYKFTGYERDPESGNDFANARYFSSQNGRFLSADPLGLGAADPGNPQSLNRYAYVQNNPMSSTDPSGLFCQNDSGCGIDAMAAMGIGVAFGGYGGSFGAVYGSYGTVLGPIGRSCFWCQLLPSISRVDFPGGAGPDLSGCTYGGGVCAGGMIYGYTEEKNGSLWRTFQAAIGEMFALNFPVQSWYLSRKRRPKKQYGPPPPNAPKPPLNPADPPGPGWNWTDDDGGKWVNPGTGEELHPDLNHKPPIGPHWDWTDPFGKHWRLPPAYMWMLVG